MARGFDPARLPFPRFAALFLLLLAVSCAPLFASDILPLVDYPNHLARMQLLASIGGSPVLQQFYRLAWRPIPDLAMDVVVPPLLRVLPLAIAGKLFVFAAFFLLAGGAAALHRVVFRRWSAWPCLAFLLLYGRLLLWGFLNYLFGLGLAFFAFAGWIALGGRSVATRLILGAVFALVIYFAHLMAFGVYALLVLGYEAGQVLRRRAAPGEGVRALAVAVLPLALPVAILFLAGGAEGGAVRFSAPARKLDLLFSVFDLYHRPFDIAGFAVMVLGLGVAYWRRWLVLAPAMAAPLALLTLAYLAMPTQLMTASGVDRRLPLALFLLLFAAGGWLPRRRRVARIYLAAALLLLLLRVAIVTASWQASGREYRVLLAGLDALPVGSRLAIAYPPDAVNVTATPLLHLPVLAAARRDAFVPTLFAAAGQQPIALQPPFRALADALPPERLWDAAVAGKPPLDAAGRAALAQYDAVAFAAPRPFALADARGLAPLFVTPRFRLYRVVAPAARLDGGGAHQ